ncbi:MAG: glycosyltransferase family 4 protein [Thermoanaerobaculales bacterium]|jgi:glycosyltransferase involved in cell wall biosynthesis|nr:glycosyltransferase family 4 protein [Thermoanaerobaculales bacterium]
MGGPTAAVAGAKAGHRERRLGVLVVGDETVASTRFRVLAHRDALAAAGYRVEVAFQRPRPASRLLRAPLRLIDELRDLRRHRGADLLLVHRRCYPPRLARVLARRGAPVVFDVDDALYLPSPAEPQTASARGRYRRNFDATAAAAELVLCGNAEIAGEVAHERTEILPTAVDCDRFRPEALAGGGEGAGVGWVGHSSNIGYLEALAEPLRELAVRRPDFRLIVFADEKPRLEGVPMEFRRWSLAAELDGFRDMKVGLMPLVDDAWTRAKCAFKLLQYMALGLPAVASPVGMNRQVVQDGHNAVLASSGAEWVAALERLLVDAQLRRRLGEAGRETVVRKYSQPVIADRLVGTLDRVVAANRERLS